MRERQFEVVGITENMGSIIAWEEGNVITAPLCIVRYMVGFNGIPLLANKSATSEAKPCRACRPIWLLQGGHRVGAPNQHARSPYKGYPRHCL